MNFRRVHEEPEPGVEIGRYDTAREAKERMLVLLSAGVPCRIREERPWFLLEVDAQEEGRAQAELAANPPEPVELRPPGWRGRIPGFSAPAALLWSWLLIISFWWQLRSPGFQEWGNLDSEKFVGGEWWRAATALGLHGDTGHLLANILFGSVFLGFLAAETGVFTALAWTVLGGIIGNALNGWFYGLEGHTSIGASTAVFASLGPLIVARAFSNKRERRSWGRAWRDLILPLGCGLGFLAWLGGASEPMVDYMAHFWGLLAGGILGLMREGLLRLRPKPRPPEALAAYATPESRQDEDV